MSRYWAVHFSDDREASVGLLAIGTVADAQGCYQEGSPNLLGNSTVALKNERCTTANDRCLRLLQRIIC
jgi:hypothetical protein